MDNGMIFVLIILFLFALPITFVGIWTSHKREMAKLNKELGKAGQLNIQNELAAVKTRLEVLEAIVTDKKYQLDQEITSLRTEGRVN